MGIMMSFPFTGGAINPVRWFGPALANSSWDDWWVYIVGPVGGGAVAALLYDFVVLQQRSAPRKATKAKTR
jgi:glycerol uptake facilitator-like aquaporin